MILEASDAANLDSLENGAADYEGVEDEYAGIPEYSIYSYGIDFDVSGVVRRLNTKDIEIPDFQRGYVWPKSRASLFIESLLLGLPVPGIFLYRETNSEKLTVVDGHQRLLSLQNFYPSPDGNQEEGQRLKLQSLESKFNGLTYNDLKDEDRRKLDNSIIHATVMNQNNPDDGGSSQYSVFERLNTGGMLLRPQEIRSAIYQGEFNNLLGELNKNNSWRKLVSNNPDKRKRDQELILRFLALYYRIDDYRLPMKTFLNNFMSENSHLEIHDADSIRSTFESAVETILEKIGGKAFKPRRAVNAAVLDAVMIGIARRLETGEISSCMQERHEKLLNDDSFVAAVSRGTSQGEKVRSRIELATNAFKDVE